MPDEYPFDEYSKAKKTEHIVNAIYQEYLKASRSNPPFNSAHEGWAVIMEEVDELWEEVRKKKANRSVAHMKKEAKQIAAMGLRFIIDICDDDNQR